MIQIHIYNYNLSVKRAVLTSPSFSDLKYGKAIMAITQASFEVDITDDKITSTNLKKFNRVKIYNNGVLEFNGYIANYRHTPDASGVKKTVVTCKHIFALFEKRITGTNDSYSGNPAASIFYYLNATNLISDTQINEGLSNSTGDVDLVDFKSQSIFRAWLEVAKAGEAEFEIDGNDTLNVYDRIGTDKSASVVLRFNEDQSNANNVRDFDFLSESDEMYNYLLGQAGNLSSIKEDLAYQGEYGLLQKPASFNVKDASQDTLDALTQAELDENKEAKMLLSFGLDNDRIDPDSISLGDIVNVQAIKGRLINLDQNFRVSQINVTMQGEEKKVSLVLANPDTKNRIPNFSEDYKDLLSRVSKLERA